MVHVHTLQVRDKVFVGFIKDTKEYGNTSVSMGAARAFGDAGYIGLLNCGTGGIKSDSQLPCPIYKAREKTGRGEGKRRGVLASVYEMSMIGSKTQ